MTRFYLMNKHKRVALVEVHEDYVNIIETYCEIPSYFVNFEHFITKHLGVIDRDNLIKLAKISSINSIEDLFRIGKAISVTDTLWMNQVDKQVSWSMVNPYKNRISNIMAYIAIEGVRNSNKPFIKSPSPQYRLGGSTDKCIKRVSDRICIYKTDGACYSDINGNRPYSEYFTSKLEEILGVRNYVKYDVIENETNDNFIRKVIKPYSRCEVFTNEKYGLIEYGNTVYSKQEFTKFLKMINNSTDKETIRDMLMIDSIILNPDRHDFNLGFIINNDTLDIKCIAPIYDNDLGFGPYTLLHGESIEEAYIKLRDYTSPQGKLGRFDEQALMAIDKTWYNRLRSAGIINIPKGKFIGISDKRVEFINYIINRRIKEIIQLVREKHNLKD